MSEQVIDLEKIRESLYEKLKPSGWADKLKTFIMGSEFIDILEKLEHEVKIGNRFTPKLKYLFRAFEECPYQDLKVVILGQDPYPQEGVADGVAFSCSITQQTQPSLRYIYKDIRETVKGYDTHLWFDHDLKHWSNQGVLLLNSALTTRINKPGTQTDIWEPFTTFVLDTLAKTNPGLTYAFLGTAAKKYHSLIPDKANVKLYAQHPAAAAYNKEQLWDSGKLFVKINEEMIGKYGEPIKW